MRKRKQYGLWGCLALTVALFAFSAGYITGQSGSGESFVISYEGTAFEQKALPLETRGLININKANAAELADLPGIGPVMAQRIIDYRTENGFFAEIEELLFVKGIGEKTLDKLAPYVILG